MRIELERLDRIAYPMGVMDLALAKDGRQTFAACMDGIYAFTLRDRNASKEPAQQEPVCIGRHASYVSGIAYAEDARSLISSSYDGTLQIRDLSNVDTYSASDMEPRYQSRIHSFWSWRMALSPDQRYVASVTGQYLAGSEDYSPMASVEPTVLVLNAGTGELVHSFHMLPSVQCVAFDPTSRYVAAGNLIGDLAVWDIERGIELARWNTPSFTSWGIIKSHCYIGGIYAVAFSPDSESLYAAGMGEMRDPMAANGKQRWQRFAWRSKPIEKLQETQGDESGEGLMETLAWSPCGEYFAMAGRLRGGNWNVGLFSKETGKIVGQAKTGMRITRVCFDAEGNTMLCAGMQGQPAPKNGTFPKFGYLERYAIKRS
jgi:WD40 repeat protein